VLTEKMRRITEFGTMGPLSVRDHSDNQITNAWHHANSILRLDPKSQLSVLLIF